MDMSVQRCLALPDLVVEFAVAKDNDESAVLVLRDHLATNYTRLHRRLTRHLGCADLASDSLHDAWLRLGDSVHVQMARSPEAYVYRVACNLAMDRLRGRRSSQYVDEGETVLEHLVDPVPGPDFIAEMRSDVEAVERAMRHLSRRHRTVLVALRLEEKTRQEVADWLRISLRSVDTVLRQALDHCAEESGQTVMVGVRSPRPGLSRQWGPRTPAREKATTCV